MGEKTCREEERYTWQVIGHHLPDGEIDLDYLVGDFMEEQGIDGFSGDVYRPFIVSDPEVKAKFYAWLEKQRG